MPIPISVLVQTKNEEASIQNCLCALGEFDEVIVVDSESADETAAIALACGARIVQFRWNRKYPKKKQWQLENVQTANEWVLFLDADETPSRELVDELRALFESEIPDRFSAFDVMLDYWFAGRLLRHGHRVVKRALVKRADVKFPIVDDLQIPGMGELEGHYQPVTLGGQTGRLRGRILHNDPDPVRTWFDRHNRYSDWEAHLKADASSRSMVAQRRSRQGQLFARVPMKPLAFFLYSYWLRLGFLDGRAGFDYAVALSVYYWQIGLKYRELVRMRA